MKNLRLNWILLATVASVWTTGCDGEVRDTPAPSSTTGGTITLSSSAAGATATGTPSVTSGSATVSILGIPISGIGNKGATNTNGNNNPVSGSADLCGGKGPIVTIPGTTTTVAYDTCTGRIAETRFVNALCTCKNASITGYLRTRAFDSKKGMTEEAGGSVGINHTYLNSAGFTDVGGSFSIAGNDSLSLAGYLKTGGDFRSQGAAKVLGYTKVGRNMWLGNGFTDLGPVNVDGDLHASGTIVALPLIVGGKQYQESVKVPLPCPCEPKDMLDIAGMVAQAKVKNDNAIAGLIPSMFNTIIGYANTTLPCGRFYIEGIGGIGNVIINVTGRAALFVDGSINNMGNLEFRLSPNAEIDIFIRDNLAITGRATFGQKDRPSASRVYIGGDGDVMLVGDGEFVGNLYAPQSLVQAVGYGAFLGSLFARDFICPGFADFSYDKAIKTAGDSCNIPTPPTCTQCGTCTDGTACVGGKCTTCRTDADCCSQQICVDGKCVEPGKIF
jgi:hypothetical protein